MSSKSKSRSKGKSRKKDKVKYVENLPKKPDPDTIYKMPTKRGTRYFKGSGRELMVQVKKPKK